VSRRLVAIAQDLTVNGIDGGFPHQEAPGPWRDAVTACRDRLEETLEQIAVHAPAQIQAGSGGRSALLPGRGHRVGLDLHQQTGSNSAEMPTMVAAGPIRAC